MHGTTVKIIHQSISKVSRQEHQTVKVFRSCTVCIRSEG